MNRFVGPSTSSFRALHYAGVTASIAAVYFGAAKLGLSMAFTAEEITLVWPPAGIALAAILLFGYRVWPGIALGAFLANATTSHETLATAASIALGNTLEAVLGAWLLHRVGFRPTLERIRDVAGLVGLAALLSTTVSATVGVANLCLAGIHPWSQFASLWWIWWLGDAIGDVLVAPVLLVWSNRPRIHWQPRRIVEVACVLALLIGTALVVFANLWTPSQNRMISLKFLMLPFIIWAAVRFRQPGTTLVSILVCAVALWGIIHNGDSLSDESLAVLQSFMGVLTITGLLLAAAMSERLTADRDRAAGDAVTKILAESWSLDEAVPRILSAVCKALEWDAGAVWRVDQPANLLRCVEVWHDPIVSVPQFESITRQRTFEPGVGLPGRVWASGAPAWIPDVVGDTNFPRGPIAAKEGLHGAFGFPIRLHERILGVIEVFSRKIQEPEYRLLQLMETLGGQIGQFIERKRSEEALQSAQAQLQMVTDTMAAAVTRCNRERRYVWVSRRYAEWLGRSPEQVAGKPILEIIGADAYHAIQPHIERVLAGQRVEYEALVAYSGIGPRWVHAVYVPTYGVAGVPDGWVAAVTDTTRHKELEEAVRQSEKNFRRLLDKLPAAAYTCDANGLITYFNKRAVEIWGREPQLYDPVDRWCGSCRLLSPGGSLITHEQSWMALALRNDEDYEAKEIVVERPDGHRCTLLAHVNPIHDESGKMLGAVNILVDITDRKRYERELQEADRRKDEFLGMLAHELRNPLAVISNASQVLDRIEGHDSHTVKLRSMITRQAHVLARIVDDLLDVSRLSRGKIKLDMQPVEVSTLVPRAVEAVRLLVESNRQEFEVSVGAEPMWVVADPTRLEQILVNLLSNASKYTDPGGRINLIVESENREIVFTVRDTGIGISAELLPHVFDLFVQAEKSIARSQGGLGIGLSLVQSLVKMHGGTVKACSDGPGKGSKFIVRLPELCAETTGLVADPSLAQCDGPRLRILVLDDNPDVAETVVMLLDSLGHEAWAVHSGIAALEAARTARPDVMLIDLGMPEMDGYEVARRVRAEPALNNLLLFALSGYGSEEDRRRTQEAGFDAHLIKPVGASTLQSLLRAKVAETVGSPFERP